MTDEQVNLFLADGKAGGLTTANITNWIGSIVSARGSDRVERLTREEISTGVVSDRPYSLSVCRARTSISPAWLPPPLRGPLRTS